MIPTPVTVTPAEIVNAKDILDYARLRGDRLKIDLAENTLNDLLDKYSYHVCHGSQPERTK